MNPPKPYSVTDLSESMKGTLHGSKDIMIANLSFDSRKVIQASGTLFFALKTKKSDGHQFLMKAYEKGVRAFIVSHIPEELNALDDTCCIVVSDPLKALQAIAAEHRSKIDIPVIGITGSYGKTIIKEWLFHLLDSEKTVVRNPKSYNSQIGVPLSVWNMNPTHEIGVFEAGISQPDEMDQLEIIIKPSIGIFSNIGAMHSENFKDIGQQVNEKMKLFKHVDALIYCKDHAEIDAVASNLVKTFTWSKGRGGDLSGITIDLTGSSATIKGQYLNKHVEITIPFIDPSSIENAIHCWATLLYLGIDSSNIQDYMSNLPPVAMRLQLKEGINNCTIVNDSYNLDINSLNIALDFLNQQNQHPKKTAILSDMRSVHQNEESTYTDMAFLLKEKGIGKIIGIGDSISKYAQLFDLDKAFYATTDDFISEINISDFSNETILLKGAFGFPFEKIEKVLQQKTHSTVLEINLNALINNLDYFKSKIGPATKLMAVVKAFSYGSGSYEIANVLQYHNVDYLAVAYVDEGMELRKAGIRIPIMVMNPTNESFEAMMKYELEPEIYSFKILKELVAFIQSHDISAFPIHIKIDSGMHRLGFEPGEINELIEQINTNASLEVKSIFSHLSGSEDKNMDEFTQSQFEVFEDISNQIIAQLNGSSIIKHILNTNGIVRFPEHHLGMVRLGMGLHGIISDPETQKSLLPTSSLKSTISQIKTVKSSDAIGYGRKGELKQDTTVATIPIGFADGLRRSFGLGKGKMYLNGSLAPSVGEVCMDMTMIDITGIDAKEGDEVEIFGLNRSISDYADSMSTIPYEVLTDVSRRVKRVYYQE
ncbi:MAG: bifunctional UDP-N-acetylmuramoyl-tripeptide:D-alanyl-D-alanine ligase/alanine racemase [Bacteroidetes bacterium]|nr:bifunctional UDP-N-acetylmuramoyl-tripeptide:D-alanyl-D-alanine ligase/alanine racemase [Bacteroidota bacterium]